MGIYMSASLDSNNIPTSTTWTPVWSIADYDPELSVVETTGGGALMSFGGYLYWGEMHVPGESLIAWQQMHPGGDSTAAITGTYRPISLFRGKNFGTPQQSVELLYGLPNLPVYDNSSQSWKIVPNLMNQAPRYGLAGFGNFYNNYDWWMEVYQNQLYVGTMDFSYLVSGQAGTPLLELPFTLPQSPMNNQYYWGADLWRFPSSNSPALPVSLAGVENYLNYGIRTMVADDNGLYLGTANPMNLKTGGAPQGGWELLQIQAHPQ
jgi:hypothetical protein